MTSCKFFYDVTWIFYFVLPFPKYKSVVIDCRYCVLRIHLKNRILLLLFSYSTLSNINEGMGKLLINLQIDQDRKDIIRFDRLFSQGWFWPWGWLDFHSSDSIIICWALNLYFMLKFVFVCSVYFWGCLWVNWCKDF